MNGNTIDQSFFIDQNNLLFGARGGTRTPNICVLSAATLPVGLHGLIIQVYVKRTKKSSTKFARQELCTCLQRKVTQERYLNGDNYQQ